LHFKASREPGLCDLARRLRKADIVTTSLDSHRKGRTTVRAMLSLAVIAVAGWTQGSALPQDAPIPQPNPVERTPVEADLGPLWIRVSGVLRVGSPGAGVTFPEEARAVDPGPGCADRVSDAPGASGWPGVVVVDWRGELGAEGELPEGWLATEASPGARPLAGPGWVDSDQPAEVRGHSRSE